ncbi:MAG TPA: hypothetical protein VJZ32_09535 [Candidatus Bathyarchaeia archaeon]|nr:hypothetical protein [Candidatus Bathyarchaeia archaeon]
MVSQTNIGQNPPTLDFLKAVNALLDLKLPEDRLDFILNNVKSNWEFYRNVGTVQLNKEDDPGIYLCVLSRLEEEHGKR